MSLTVRKEFAFDSLNASSNVPTSDSTVDIAPWLNLSSVVLLGIYRKLDVRQLEFWDQSGH